jgi:polar amino acid transport system permease protein
VWSPLVYGAVAVIGGYLFLYELGVLGVYRLSYATLILPGIVRGFYVSLELVAVYIPIGFGVGFVVGWARTTQSVILRGLGGVYVDFFRSMPPLALIFFASLIGAVALKSTSLDPYTQHSITLWLGVVALGLHTGGYQAEIVRAGILSVPAGQTEAADALGIPRLRTMFSVVLPQAFRVSLPPLANEFSSVIKDSAYLAVIGWFELAGAGFSYASETFRYHYPEAALVTWFEVALLFFVLTYIVTRTLRGIEDAFRVPGLEAAAL